ncbi:hypothetical protein GCM10020358_81970 [Amorphoplanes nipponensis]|uniref:Methyltransferase domain-containing protein n=1 Tax=Actinoplanes nipponensis TaxID=135950 RepID=A0A919MLX3_9ACTN|nr:hypothetical protein Ani05nite_03520 [Actinoplanes nipponensis]
MADHHHHRHEPAHDTDALADMLDLDAEVLRDHLDGLVEWLHERTGGRARRILDLGCGTGTGALALATRFPDAEVTAVDMAEPMLHRVRAKARAHGLDGRIHTRQADLDAGWPALAPMDLVWASASLHHVAEPDRVLADVLATLRPGGVFAVAELEAIPTFLPDDLGVGRPGLEARCHAALREGLSHEVPLLGSDWGPRLARAGFTVEAERVFRIELTPPLPAAAGRYAQACLRRLRTGLDGRLDAQDRDTLDTLLDSDAILSRTDLTVRTTRTVWLAVRP